MEAAASLPSPHWCEQKAGRHDGVSSDPHAPVTQIPRGSTPFRPTASVPGFSVWTACPSVVIPAADCHTPSQRFVNLDNQQPASACPAGVRQSRQPALVCGTPPEAPARTFLHGSYHVVPGSVRASVELGLRWGPSQEALEARTPTGQPWTQLEHYRATSGNDMPEGHTGWHRSPTKAHPAL